MAVFLQIAALLCSCLLFVSSVHVLQSSNDGCGSVSPASTQPTNQASSKSHSTAANCEEQYHLLSSAAAAFYKLEIEAWLAFLAASLSSSTFVACNFIRSHPSASKIVPYHHMKDCLARLKRSAIFLFISSLTFRRVSNLYWNEWRFCRLANQNISAWIGQKDKPKTRYGLMLFLMFASTCNSSTSLSEINYNSTQNGVALSLVVCLLCFIALYAIKCLVVHQAETMLICFFCVRLHNYCFHARVTPVGYLSAKKMCKAINFCLNFLGSK